MRPFLCTSRGQRTGRVDVLLPSDQSLLGAAIFNQALVVDRSANALGAVVSNAGVGKAGAK